MVHPTLRCEPRRWERSCDNDDGPPRSPLDWSPPATGTRHFSVNGILPIHAWPGAAEGDGGAFHALAIDADGRILAAGHHAIDGEVRIAIARIASAGHLHRTFSNDGALELDSPRTSSAIEWIGADDRGRVVFAGTAEGITLWDVVVGRVTSDGLPDPSFGGDGVIRTDVDAYQDFANDALIDGRGRLLVGGGTDDGTEGDVGLLLRYLTYRPAGAYPADMALRRETRWRLGLRLSC
jgi:beta-propeller uncharacterized protein DUF5122